MDLHSVHVYTSHRCSILRIDYNVPYKPHRFHGPVDHVRPPLRDQCSVALELMHCLHTLKRGPWGGAREINPQKVLV